MSPCASCQMCCRSEVKPNRPAVFLTVGDRMKQWVSKISPSFQVWSE
mgnify:CR=1 FL=1